MIKFPKTPLKHMPNGRRFPPVLKENIMFNIELIGVQVRNALRVQGRARSGYYKVAILLAAAIAEALAHQVLKMRLESGTAPPNNPWECYECHDLPQSHQQATFKLAICKRRQLPFDLTARTDFARVNKVCLDLGIFSEQFFRKIERVRDLRNRIHLQGLDQVDRSYTKRQLMSVSYVLNKLLDKLTL